MITDNDRDLLELAAKAAGIECHPDGIYWTANELGDYWNPLTDDGDALRLAVKLNLTLYISKEKIGVVDTDWMASVTSMGEDPYAATRRAIVKAAAIIGESL